MSGHRAPTTLVWSESNHKMTSIGWWVLCKLPPTVTRPKEAVRFPLWGAKSHGTSNTWDVCFSLQCDLKETKPETFRRFWCQITKITSWLTSAAIDSTLVVELSGAHTAGFICSHTAWDTLPHSWPYPVIWFNERSCVTNHSVWGMTG